MRTALKLFVNLSLFLLLSLFLQGQVTVGLYPAGAHLQFVDQNGAVLSGGKIFTCSAGQVCPGTPLATYTDNTGTVQNTNPILLDSTGSPSNGGTPVGFYLTSAAYKVVAQDVNGVTKWTADNIVASTATDNAVYARLDGTNLPYTANIVLVGGTGTATVTNNFSSRTIELDGSYWNGSLALNDRWILQDVLGTGSNPPSTLVVSHAGSAGAPGIQLPAIMVGIPHGGTGFQHVRTAAGCTTALAAGASCSVIVTWPTAFIDTNYTVSCIGNYADAGANAAAYSYASKTTTGLTVFAASITSTGVAPIGFDCIGVHD